MLNIRREQMETLRAPHRERRILELVAHVREHFPDETADRSEEDLRAHVREAVERAEKYGIRTDRDVCKYVNVSVLHGPDFDERGETEWTVAYLTDGDVPSPTLRMDRLHAEVVHRLSVEESDARIRRQFYGSE